MSGLVASRLTGSWWRRLALVTWMVMAGQLAASAVEVTTFTSTNVPLRIPQAAGQFGGRTDSVVQVAGVLTPITKVTVSIYITHQVPGDLVISLIPPGGGNGVQLIGFDDINSTQVTGSIGQPFVLNTAAAATTGLGTGNTLVGRVHFADDGVAIDPGNTAHVNNGFNQVHLLPGTYLPVQALAAFNGLTGTQANGTWTLRIEDEFEENYTGTLVYWSITITEPGPHTWTGEGADDNWSTVENWLNDSPPTLPEVSTLLIFPAAAAGTTNNDIGDIRVGTMTVDGAYTFTTSGAGKLTLVANSTVAVNSAIDVALNSAIDLVGQPTITVNGAGSLDLSGIIANDGAAAGLIFAGPGPKSISGANTYTGATAVNDGILDVENNTALGTNAAGTTVANGATVRLAVGVNSPDTITIQGTGDGDIGALVFAGNGAVGGMTLVAARPATITVVGGATTIGAVTAAAITAIHTLSVTNAGTLAINGALPTTTALTLDGGATTFGIAQPNITTLALRNGADLDVGASATVSSTISVGASGDTSTISGTTLSLGGGDRSITVTGGAAGVGGEANTTSSDLLISANMSTGGFTKRGGGVLRITGNNTGVSATVSGGTLAGAGNIGSINVLNGALSPSGQFTVGGGVNLASRTGFILPVGATANPAISATGAVMLNGVGGVGGAVLQVYAGDGNVIITSAAGPVIGTFDGKSEIGAGITYNVPSGTVELAGSGGRSLAFTPAGPFVVEENVGTLEVTVTATPAGGAIPFLRTFGGLVEGRDLSLVGLAPAGTYVFTIPINDNFVDTGDVSGTLAIVPQDGSLVSNSATLTIRDNDGSDTKTCGFGTGLTVFLLLGFGLLLHVRLRRS